MARSATEAECERLQCRLAELAEAKEHLTSLVERARPDIEVESIEWQRPLTVGEAELESFSEHGWAFRTMIQGRLRAARRLERAGDLAGSLTTLESSPPCFFGN